MDASEHSVSICQISLPPLSLSLPRTLFPVLAFIRTPFHCILCIVSLSSLPHIVPLVTTSPCLRALIYSHIHASSRPSARSRTAPRFHLNTPLPNTTCRALCGAVFKGCTPHTLFASDLALPIARHTRFCAALFGPVSAQFRLLPSERTRRSTYADHPPFIRHGDTSQPFGASSFLPLVHHPLARIS